MYDEDPTLFVAGAAGAGTLAFTGSNSMWLLLVGVAAVIVGFLALRLASWSTRRSRNSA